jgi:hypothetical protein
VGVQGQTSLMGLRGTPSSRDWPETWRSLHELGARKAMRKSRAHGEFSAAWQAGQLLWMRQMCTNLNSGGRAALLVGDGESAINALQSTADAASEAGLSLMASATISSTAQRADQHKGRRRPEHLLLLEKR